MSWLMSVGVKTWSFTLGDNTPLEVFGVRVLRREFGPNRRQKLEAGKNSVARSFMIFTLHQKNMTSVRRRRRNRWNV